MSKEIGSRIRKLRVNRDYNQEKMASELGLTPGAYAKIERGETDPSASRLFQIAKILKVDIVALLKDDAEQGHSKKSSAISRAEWEQLSRHVVLLGKELEQIKAGITPGKEKTRKKN